MLDSSLARAALRSGRRPQPRAATRQGLNLTRRAWSHVTSPTAQEGTGAESWNEKDVLM